MIFDAGNLLMRLCMILFLVFPVLAACGVKPGVPDAPVEAQQDSFPRTYPALSTDPSPEK